MTDPITRARITQAERQHLLYKPWTDANCQLYLPFSDLSFRDNPFYSKDINFFGLSTTEATLTPYGYTFAGVSDKLKCGANVPFNTANVFSAALWVYPSDVTTDAITMISLGSGLPNSAYLTEFSLRAGHPRLSTVSSGFTSQQSILTISTWYHLAVVHDGANDNVKIYINSVKDTDETYTTDNLTATGEITVGCLNAVTPSQFFNGKIGEVIVYNKALTALEISNMYQATKWYYGL